MKGLNKLALATAVAAAPFATQAMEPMTDESMGNTTGQAGVTIELQTAVDIEQIEYDQNTNGSFAMQGISIGGVGRDGFSDTLDITVDIDLVDDETAQKPFVGENRTTGPRDLADGDALISLGSTDDGGGDPAEASPANMNIGVDGMGLTTSGADSSFEGDLGEEGGSALLMSDMNVDLFISQLDIVASNDEAFDTENETNTGSIGIDVAFVVDSFDMDFDVAAVSLSGVRMAGVGSLDDLRDNTTEEMAGLALSNPATVSMDIGAGGTLEGFSNVNQPEDGDVLRVSIDHFEGDVWMPEIEVGGGSVGNVGISNLQVSETEMAIYGRD